MLRASTISHHPARCFKHPIHCCICFPRSAGSFVRCEALKTMAAMGHLPRQVDTLLFDLRVKFLVHLCPWHRFEISNWTRGTSSRMDPLALESIDGSAKTKGRQTVVSRHGIGCHPLSS